MVGKTLLWTAVIGGIVYALLKTQRKVFDERIELSEASSRWEGEGGAPLPNDEAAATV